MKIGKKEANLLLVLLGIAIVVTAYYAIYTRYVEKADALNASTASLALRLAELQTHYSKLDEYYESIDAARAVMDSEMSRYPDDIRTEDLIMYAVKLEDVVGFQIDSISFPGSSSISDFSTLDENDSPVTHTAWQIGLTINGSFSYAELKDGLDYIYDTRDCTTADTVSITYNAETTELSGSMSINKFFVTGPDYVYEPTAVPTRSLGNLNPFGTLVRPEAAAAEPAQPDEAVTPAA